MIWSGILLTCSKWSSSWFGHLQCLKDMLSYNFRIHWFRNSFKRITIWAMLWWFSCSKLYTRVVVNFMMCLLFKFGGIWSYGLGTMHILNLVKLWIMPWYLKMKRRQLHKLSIMSLCLSIGVIELQLWSFLAAAVNMLKILNFWNLVMCV
jgi:hypothetical protein